MPHNRISSILTPERTEAWVDGAKKTGGPSLLLEVPEGDDVPFSQSPSITPASPLGHKISNWSTLAVKSSHRLTHSAVASGGPSRRASAGFCGLMFKIALYVTFVVAQIAHLQLSTTFRLQRYVRQTLTTGVVPASIQSNPWVYISPTALTDVKSFGDSLVWLTDTFVPFLWASGAGNSQEFNQLLGGVRLQQRRLKSAECSGLTDLAASYTAWSKQKYGITCFSESEYDNSAIAGTLQQGLIAGKEDFYSYWLLSNSSAAAVNAEIQAIREAGWLSDATDLFRVQGAFYCGQVSLYVFIDVVFTSDLVGSVKPKLHVHALPAEVFSRMSVIVADLCVVGLLALLMLWEVFGLLCACRERRVLVHLGSFTTLLNVAVVIFGAFFAFWWFHFDTALENLLAPIGRVMDLSSSTFSTTATLYGHLNEFYDDLADLVMMSTYSEPAAMCFMMVNMAMFLKNFEANPRLAIITSTLYKAASDLIHFLFIFAFVFLTFTVGAHLVFGQHLQQWSTVNLASNSGFRALMGDFNFAELYTIAPVTATVWFWSFMILTFLIMLNMLLAILMDAYQNVKDEAGHSETLFDMVRLKLDAAMPTMTRMLALSPERQSALPCSEDKKAALLLPGVPVEGGGEGGSTRSTVEMRRNRTSKAPALQLEDEAEASRPHTATPTSMALTNSIEACRQDLLQEVRTGMSLMKNQLSRALDADGRPRRCRHPRFTEE